MNSNLFDYPVLLVFIVGLLLSDDDKKKYALIEIEKILKRTGTSLTRFESMPKLPRISSHDSNVLVLDEHNYFRSSLLETLDRDISKMTSEQRKIYDKIFSVTLASVDFFKSMNTFMSFKTISNLNRCYLRLININSFMHH